MNNADEKRSNNNLYEGHGLDYYTNNRIFQGVQ